jgi:hypothetical protein
VDTKASPAQADLKLKADSVSLAEAARLASAAGVAFDSKTKLDGQVSADLTAQGAVNKPALNGTLNARNLTISGQGIPAPVKMAAIDLLLTPQQIHSGPFTATSENTSVNGQFAVTNYTSPSPAIDATLRTANAQIANLLTMARAYGVSALNGYNGSGLLMLDVHASGPVKNANAMTFNGTGQIQNASLQPPSLRQPLKIRNANLNFTNNGAQIQNLSASLGQTDANGEVTIRNFAAPNVQFTLTANKVDVIELQQITGSAPAQNTQQKAAWFTLVPRVSAEPAPATAAPAILQKMTGGGTLSVGTLHYDQLTISNLRSNVTLNRGVIGMSPLTAQLYDGVENGAITVDTHYTNGGTGEEQPSARAGEPADLRDQLGEEHHLWTAGR